MVSMNHGSSISNWKPWLRLDLVFMMRDIYLNSNPKSLTKLISSSRSTEFKDIHLWNTSQMIKKIVPISLREVINYMMKLGISFWVWQKVDGNWNHSMIRIFQWRENHCRINTIIRRKKWIQKSMTARFRVRDPRRKVNHVSKVIWNDRRVHQVYQFH